MLTREQGEKLILDCYRAGLLSAEPATAVQRYLQRDGRVLLLYGPSERYPVMGRLSVVAIGKAAVEMAAGAERACGDLIDEGLVLTKDGHGRGRQLRVCEVMEAAHPVPDTRGERATEEIMRRARQLGSGDVLLALISGGGSALLEAPRPPLTLADLARTTDLLLRAGAPIQDLNAVRIPLSQVKGGGLRRAAGRATTITLILSDVLGNDPRVIASGPTVAGDSEPLAARRGWEVLARYDLQDQVAASVKGMLEQRLGSDADRAAIDLPGDVPRSATPSPVRIVGDNRIMVDAAAIAASTSGVEPRVIWMAQEGEASDLGRAWVNECRAAPLDVGLLLGGGEATVRVRGAGTGGRNTEFALAAAMELARSGVEDWVVASLATDGQDGSTGAAGAIADAGTVARARSAGVDSRQALLENDSLRFFDAAGGLVQPGPTGTNVNDLYLAVRISSSVP